jgi:hypothetical protein
LFWVLSLIQPLLWVSLASLGEVFAPGKTFGQRLGMVGYLLLWLATLAVLIGLSWWVISVWF